MTADAPRPPRADPGARALPKLALMLGIALLAGGWVVALTIGQTYPLVTRVLVDVGLAFVVAVPILNVIAVLTVEWQRRGRLFVLAAAFVLLMIALNVAWRS